MPNRLKESVQRVLDILASLLVLSPVGVFVLVVGGVMPLGMVAAICTLGIVPACIYLTPLEFAVFFIAEAVLGVSMEGLGIGYWLVRLKRK